MTKETYFEELSYALRRRELLPRPVEEDGLLPVELLVIKTKFILTSKKQTAEEA